MRRVLSHCFLPAALLATAFACSDSDSNERDSTGNLIAQAGAGGAGMGTAGAGGNSAGSAGVPTGTAGTEDSMGTAGASMGAAGASMGAAGASMGAGGAALDGSDAGVDAGPLADAAEDAGQPAEDDGPTGADLLVALTFDDGPDNTLTAAVLDKLEAHDVPASFFLVGQNVNAGTQAILQRAASLGCEFENHSAGFGSLTGLSQQEVQQSINTTTQAIVDITGTTPVFFRPPNLAVDANMQQSIDLAFAGGVLGGDFPGGNNGGNPTVQSVTAAVLGGVVDGSIILLHDVQPGLNPQVTPDALDNIIPTLKGQGFEFVTLRQLFELRGVDPSLQQDVLVGSVPPQGN